MKIRKPGSIKKILVSVMLIALISGTVGCKGKQEANTAFEPALPTDTSCSVKVAGSYSNFEALESEFDRFYEYYPNVSLDYVYLDDYNNTIASALMSSEAPDIFVTQSWMLDDEKMKPVIDSAEVLSDPSLNIDMDCIRDGARWPMANGDIIMLPVFTRSYGMLVNMDIFEKNGLKVPEDYAGLTEVCKKLKAAGYANPVMGANGNTTSGLYYAFGFPMFCAGVIGKADSVQALNTLDGSAGELMRPALERMKEFIDAGYVDPAACTEQIKDDYNAVIMRFF